MNDLVSDAYQRLRSRRRLPASLGHEHHTFAMNTFQSFTTAMAKPGMSQSLTAAKRNHPIPSENLLTSRIRDLDACVLLTVIASRYEGHDFGVVVDGLGH